MFVHASFCSYVLDMGDYSPRTGKHILVWFTDGMSAGFMIGTDTKYAGLRIPFCQ